MIYPYKCKGCEDYFELDMTIAEYKEFTPSACKKCGAEVLRVWTVPGISYMARYKLGPEDWNYNKETGEVEDGHQKTLRKIREGVPIL